jgi:NitT/TauT family transport system substrate-binding protein
MTAFSTRSGSTLDRATFVRSAAALAAGGAGVRWRPAAAAEPTPITVACVPNDGSTPALYAQHAGWFRDAGLDVTLQMFPSGAGSAAAIVGGAAQLGISSMITLLIAHDHGVPFTLVASSGVITPDNPYSQFIVRKETTYKTGRDFNGKTVGVPSLRDLDTIAIQNWVDLNGGDSKTLQFIEMPPPLAVVALEEGRIDGTEVTSPTLTMALNGGKVRVLAQIFSSISPRFLNTAWFTTVDYATTNPDVVKRFTAVLARAGKYCNAHQAETVPLVAQNAKLDEAQVAGMTRVVFADGLRPQEVQPLIDVAAKYKALSKDFSATDIISPLALKPS